MTEFTPFFGTYIHVYTEIVPTRHAELVSASLVYETLKQVQGDV